MSTTAQRVRVPTPDQLACADGADLDQMLWDLEVSRRQIEAAIVDVTARCDTTCHFVEDGHRNVRAWSQAVTNCSPSEAMRRHRSVKLFRNTERLASEFRAGRIGVAQIDELARLNSNRRCNDLLVDSEEILSDAAKALPYTDFRTVTKRWETLADADGAHEDQEACHENRHASVTEHDGQFRLEAALGVIDGTAIRTIFDKFCDAEFQTDWNTAKDKHGDDVNTSLLARTDRQRRADALATIFNTAADANPAAGKTPDPVVNVVVDLDTFEQHLRNQIDGTRTNIDPATVIDRRCETIDGKPVDPQQMVALAVIGDIRRIVINSAGVIVDAGRKRRLFTGPIREALQALQPQCTWLGCNIRANIAQIDHCDPHTNGGNTNTDNAAIMCAKHNLHKHRHGYKAHRQPNGTWQLLRPNGTPLQPPDN